MKKMVFMAAFVAATAAFVACSSNDDLVQQKPDVPEEQIEEGTPMTIIVSDLATRGTDFSSTNPLLAFKLYSTMLTPQEAALATPPETPSWTKGKGLSRDDGDSDWTTNGVLAWPDEAEHTFFAINVANDNEFADFAENDGAGDDHPDLPVVTATTCNFNYKMPISVKPKTDPEEADDYYYNSADLKDLLVAKTTGSSTTGDPVGSLTINFTHALAQITKVKLYVNKTRLAGKDKGGSVAAGSDYNVFRIGGMRIGGLKTVGKYTFDAATPWTVDVAGNGINEDVFEIPLKYDDFDHNVFYAKGSADNKFELTLSDGGFYLIPQQATGEVVSKGTRFDITGAYVELDAQVCVLNVEDIADVVEDEDNDGLNSASWRVGKYLDDGENNWKWNRFASDAIGYGQIRCPLKFALLEENKTYTLVLDLGMAVIKTNGEEGTTSADEAVFEGLDILAE